MYDNLLCDTIKNNINDNMHAKILITYSLKSTKISDERIKLIIKICN